jgi:NAD(P)-dependent dehydrogenase (short-subunit alcohol dehydrogenase family)
MSARMLEGQVALVTGAGRGLGRAFAERLAALGCHIAIHGMREHGPSEFGGTETLTDVARSIADKHSVRTFKVLGDLTISEDIERVVQVTETNLGPIDILVHNAGGDIAAAGGKPNPNDVVNIKAEDVRAVIDRNLLSTIFVCQQVARGMMDPSGAYRQHRLSCSIQRTHKCIDLCDGKSRRDAFYSVSRRPDANL